MRIVLNGKEFAVENGLSVLEILERKGFNVNTVLVEHNQQLLQKDKWPSVKLQNGDRLEIFQIVGGG